MTSSRRPWFLLFGHFLACAEAQPLPDCPSTHGPDLAGTCRLRCQASSQCLPTEECVDQLCLVRDDQGAEISLFRAAADEVPPGTTVALDFVVLFSVNVTITANDGTTTAEVLSTGAESGTLLHYNLQADTEFVLVATGGGKTATARVTVTVASGAPVEIVSFVATPSRIAVGESTRLTWQVARRDGPLRLFDDLGTTDLDDPVSPISLSPRSNTTYTLEASGPGGPVRRTTNVIVGSGRPAVIRDLVLEQPSNPKPGDNGILTWQTEDADRLQVFATGPGPAPAELLLETRDPARATSGSWIVVPEAGRAFMIVAEGGGATPTLSVSPSVSPMIEAPKLVEARVEPTIIEGQSNVNLTWAATPSDALVRVLGPQGELHSGVGETTYAYPLTGIDQTVHLVLRAENAAGVDEVFFTSYAPFNEGNSDNDDPALAEPLFDRAVRGSLEPPMIQNGVSQDWYRYELTAPGIITVEALECTGIPVLGDPDLAIYASSGGGLAPPIAQQVGPCARLETPVVPAGNYFVRVFNVGADAAFIPYTVGVTWRPALCGNGAIELGESCDDNNRIGGDTCTPDCQNTVPFAFNAGSLGNVALSPPGIATPVRIEPLAIGGDGQDRGVGVVRFPFDFPYAGQHHRGAFVHSDGYLAFLPGHSTSPIGAGLPNAAIAPFAADLRIELSGMVGTFDSLFEGEPITVIDLDGLQIKGAPAATHLEVRIGLTASGRILFRYGELRGGAQPVQAGIEDGHGIWSLAAPTCDQVTSVCSIEALPDQQLIQFSPTPGPR